LSFYCVVTIASN